MDNAETMYSTDSAGEVEPFDLQERMQGSLFTLLQVKCVLVFDRILTSSRRPEP